MKKMTLIASLFVFASSPAFALSATWTGNLKQVQTVTGKIAWNCEYNYGGQLFWKVFLNSCPYSIEVE